MPDPSQRTAEDLLSEIKEVLGEDPPVVVQPRVKQGNPARVLIEESEDAACRWSVLVATVAFVSVLGSVSQHVAAYAKCPVTVVR